MHRSVTSAALAVVALSAVVFAGPAVEAKGGQDNFERQAQLEQEFAKARKNRSEQGTGLFDLLFGTSEPEHAEAEPAERTPEPAKTDN